MMIILPLIVFVVIGLLIIYWKYGLKIQVRLKDTLNSVEDNDGKEKDVLIIFAPQDTEIAQGVLLPTLQDKYNYKCGVKELTSTINKCKHLENILKLTFLFFPASIILKKSHLVSVFRVHGLERGSPKISKNNCCAIANFN